MELGWQDFVALGIVFAAAAYLGRLAWGAVFRKRAAGCGGGCAKCPAAGGAEAGRPDQDQVVSIGGLTSDRV